MCGECCSLNEVIEGWLETSAQHLWGAHSWELVLKLYRGFPYAPCIIWRPGIPCIIHLSNRKEYIYIYKYICCSTTRDLYNISPSCFTPNVSAPGLRLVIPHFAWDEENLRTWHKGDILPCPFFQADQTQETQINKDERERNPMCGLMVITPTSRVLTMAGLGRWTKGQRSRTGNARGLWWRRK